MPVYDYRCPECDHRFEKRHGFDAPAPACPNCGHDPAQRIITSAPAVAGGLVTHAGDGRRASKEELTSKWAEETPKLRRKLEDKLGKDMVRRNVPSLYNNTE
ncbi:MAG: FmdB family zinc ribbon protein [Chloroflexota bacterium]